MKEGLEGEDMDHEAVRQEAQRHGDAVVAGDFRTAGSALSPAAQAQAPAVMKAMPSPLTAAEITSLEQDGEAYVAHIAYRGEGDDVSTVVSRWADVDGSPKIVDLSLG